MSRRRYLPGRPQPAQLTNIPAGDDRTAKPVPGRDRQAGKPVDSRSGGGRLPCTQNDSQEEVTVAGTVDRQSQLAQHPELRRAAASGPERPDDLHAVLGLVSFVLGMIVRNAHTGPAVYIAATATGLVALLVGLYAQMVSSTREQRILIVTGIIAGFVGLAIGLTHGGFIRLTASTGLRALGRVLGSGHGAHRSPLPRRQPARRGDRLRGGRGPVLPRRPAGLEGRRSFPAAIRRRSGTLSPRPTSTSTSTRPTSSTWRPATTGSGSRAGNSSTSSSRRPRRSAPRA